jgi:hypothetical protein
MNTTLPVRPPFDERIAVAVTAEEKRKIFEAAAARRLTVSELVRKALALASGETLAA